MSNDEKYIDQCGRIILTTEGVVKLIKTQKTLDGVLVEDNIDTQKYNQNSNDSKLVLYTESMHDETVDEFDLINTKEWTTPDEYKAIEIDDFLFNKCETEEQIARVQAELALYRHYDLIPLLKQLIFLIDHFRKNDIVWGVGRGSSVSSYVLYLIGVHKIDSIFYDLDINEFLK